MNYITITEQDMLNGDGIRVILWVSGCSLHCKNCQNPETWDCSVGELFTEETMKYLEECISKDYISGITFSGGHPLDKNNIDTITKISKALREKYPQKTQWLYTGYVWNDVKDLDIIKNIDILVDGPYVDELRDISLKWRGSSNQRVIDCKASLEHNKIVLWCD